MSRSLTSWRVVVLTLVVACIGIAPTFWVLWPKWVDSHTYSHGLLILPLAAWLLWRQRDAINSRPLRPVLLAVIPLLGLLFLWALSFAANIQIGSEVTLPLILLFGVLAAAGWGVAASVAFPILLLYSAVTIWDAINGLLQSLTTEAVSVMLGVLNVPAFIQGNLVQIPSGWFEIAGGCSGLHFLIVGLTLAAVYSYMYLRSFKNQLLLVGIAAVMSVVMNWVRVATIITAGHVTDMQSYLVQVDHYTFGWVLFAVLLIPFFLLARKIERSEQAERPVREPVRDQAQNLVGQKGFLVTLIVLLLPALVWARLAQVGPSPIVIELPEIAGWQGPDSYEGNWQPLFSSADGEALASYENSQRSVQVYANWYKTQEQGRELIGYGNSVTGSDFRQQYDRRKSEIMRSDHANLLEVREIMAKSAAGERRLIWYYYKVGDAAVAGRLEAKLRQGLRSILGASGTGLLAVSVECRIEDTDCVLARQVLETAFASVNERFRRISGKAWHEDQSQGALE